MPSETARRSPIQRIEDILDNIALVREFTAGCDFDAFVADKRLTYAVARAIEIISEASRHLPQDMK